MPTEADRTAAKPKRTLTSEEVEYARKLWEKGKTLGEIADDMGCSLYALTPWPIKWEAMRGA